MKVYRIRDKATGLFAVGGGNNWTPWAKKGKIWTSIGALKNHLKMVQGYNTPTHERYQPGRYSGMDIEILEYDLSGGVDIMRTLGDYLPA